MERMFVADVDDVLLDFSKNVKQWYERFYNRPIAQADRWEYNEALGIPKRVVAKMWDEIWDHAFDSLPGAFQFLQALRARGVRVIALSARKPGKARERSLEDLRRNGLMPLLDGVRYVEQVGDKAEEIRTWSSFPDFFLDDAMKNVYKISDAFPACRVMLFDAHHNQSQDIDPPYLRVKSYEAVLREVDRGVL